LEIAVGVAERRDRTAAGVLVDPDGLADLIADEIRICKRRLRASADKF